jgi:hypothetical protein
MHGGRKARDAEYLATDRRGRRIRCQLIAQDPQ